MCRTAVWESMAHGAIARLRGQVKCLASHKSAYKDLETLSHAVGVLASMAKGRAMHGVSEREFQVLWTELN
jgi:hypothetical protein